jgi:hypothetical protein
MYNNKNLIPNTMNIENDGSIVSAAEEVAAQPELKAAFEQLDVELQAALLERLNSSPELLDKLVREFTISPERGEHALGAQINAMRALEIAA